MTGQELFYALSFVDERYIQEAETARLSKTPWVKIFSVAACLCILLTGIYAYSLTQFKGALEMAPAADAPAADVPAADAPAAAAPKEEELTVREEAMADSAAPATATGELHQIDRVRLQVEKVLEDGSFEAIVKADEPMEMDTRVTVVVDPSKVPGADGDAYGGAVLALEAGDTLETANAAYDPEQNILYVTHVMIVE